MAKRIVIIVLASVLFFSWCKVTKADEIGDLKQQLAEQSKILQELQQKIGKLESSQQEQEKVIDEKVTKAVDGKKPTLPDNIKWVEKIKVSGDFRYRHESIDEESSPGEWKDGNNRHRIRARLGIDAIVNDEWKVGLRLATGSADPSSTNQTLENGFSSKDIWLDLAYFSWQPKAFEGLTAFGGKMPNPFYRAGGSQLIWDDDMTPEGFAAKYVIPMGDNDKFNLVGGGFWLAEDSSSSNGISLWGLQPYWEHIFADKSTLVLGASWFDYGNLEGSNGLYRSYTDGSLGKKTFGNTMSGTGADSSNPYKYTMDYDIMNIFTEYSFKINDLPLGLFGDYAKNMSASNSEDTGWLIGGRINKAKDPNSWEFVYNYRDVESDAVVGVLSDSDFIGGGTNGKGHQFQFKYQFTKNIQGALGYFMNEKGASDNEYRRLQADIIFKF